MARINLGNISNIGDKTVMTGSASGLDSKSVIDATIKAKEIPINKLRDNIDLSNKKILAYQQVSNLLKSFQNSANILRNPPQFDKADNIFSLKQTVINSNTQVSGNIYMGIAANNLAPMGNYQISNINLATQKQQFAQNFTTNNLSITSNNNTAGTFTPGIFQINGIDVEINDGDSLVNIESKINLISTQGNIKAQVIRIANNNFQLSLKSTKPGIDNAFVINDPSNCLSNINWNIISATDTSFEFNNITMSRSSNTIDDVVSGITFNLYQNTPPGTILDANVTNNPSAVEQAINKFIGSYNDLKSFIALQGKRDPITSKFAEDAVLGGDTTIRNIEQTIENYLVSLVNGISNNNATNLAEIGINFYDSEATKDVPQIKNLLTIDSLKLSTYLSTKFDEVKNIFEFNAYSSNSNFMVTKTSSEINITNSSVNLDSTRQIGKQAKISYTDPRSLQNTTVNAVFEQNSGGVGGIILLPKEGSILDGTNQTVKTPIDGIKLVYIGSSSTVNTNINLTQGIADKIYNILDKFLDADNGNIILATMDISSNITDKNSKITRLEDQLKDTKEKLLKQFADVEKAISGANSILQMLEASDYAKRENK